MSENDVQPITPSHAKTLRTASIPSEVIDIFNAMIVKNLDSASSRATIAKYEVEDRIMEQMIVSREMIHEGNWLDIEDLFRAKGWTVTYTQSDGVSNGRSRWTFSTDPE